MKGVGLTWLGKVSPVSQWEERIVLSSAYHGVGGSPDRLPRQKVRALSSGLPF